MKEENNNRIKWLHLRLTQAEYKQLHHGFSKSNDRKLSAYARKILLQKPIVGSFRNKSQDDLMAEAMKLRSELNNIGNNFNQAVKKLHGLNQITEFRTWLITYELEKNVLFNKVDQIKNHINKIADQWLQ